MPYLSRAHPKTVLLVVEEPSIRELLAANFRHAGYLPMPAPTVRDGWRLAGEVRPDVVLVDLDAAGAEEPPFTALCERDPGIVVVELGAGGVPEPGRPCLRIGKPFSARELVAQVTRQLRSLTAPRAPARRRALRVGTLELRADRGQVRVHGPVVTTSRSLAPVELRLLQLLMEHAGLVLSREQILQAVWPGDGASELRTVDQNIRRLRRRLQQAGAADPVVTVRGFGYRLQVGSD
ncbi:MAG: hypothetical protein ABT20_06285 [Rubrivivax sp. SCN 70-15]|nr:MAG: hypothetical protein ABT20_06285 [Rubrivivax sp. SCN 70-15]